MPNSKKRRDDGKGNCPFCVFMDTVDSMVEEFTDSEVGKHLVSAKREMLLAVKAGVDQCLSRFEAKEGETRKEKRVKRVKVE